MNAIPVEPRKFSHDYRPRAIWPAGSKSTLHRVRNTTNDPVHENAALTPFANTCAGESASAQSSTSAPCGDSR